MEHTTPDTATDALLAELDIEAAIAAMEVA